MACSCPRRNPFKPKPARSSASNNGDFAPSAGSDASLQAAGAEITQSSPSRADGARGGEPRRVGTTSFDVGTAPSGAGCRRPSSAAREPSAVAGHVLTACLSSPRTSSASPSHTESGAELAASREAAAAAARAAAAWAARGLNRPATRGVGSPAVSPGAPPASTAAEAAPASAHCPPASISARSSSSRKSICGGGTISSSPAPLFMRHRFLRRCLSARSRSAPLDVPSLPRQPPRPAYVPLLEILT
eukprot:scaffold1991_cov111-Isochrysis_galbana.AAC.13